VRNLHIFVTSFEKSVPENLKQDPYAALKYPEFRAFQLSRFLFTFAIQMAETIIGWRVYEITHDKLSLGLLGLSEALPFIITSLFAGHVADNYNRKKIVMYSNLTMLLCFVAIGFFMMGDMVVLQQYGVLPIYFLIGCSGIARGFMVPSFQSMLPQILPRELYGNGATWNSNFWQLAAVTGPAAGGIIFGFTNIYVAFVVVWTMMLFSVFAFSRIKPHPHAVKEKVESIYESLTAGLRFVFKNEEMLGAITLDLLAVLFGGAVALLPVFASDILHVGPEGLGFLRAAPFLGSVLMGLFLAYNPPLKNAGRNLLIAVGLFGLATIGFALSTSFILSFVMLFFTGAFDNVSVVIRQTILQVMTPNEMRGRVSSVNQIFISSSNEIGAFESGVAAKLMGTVPSVVFGGCMTLLVVSGMGIFAKKLRKMKL
jgi:MFS family permease